MAPLGPKGDLAAVEIAFFSPALLLGLFIIFRHGFSRQLGWLYIAVLSILRIVGASATLYIETKNDYSKGLIETAIITQAVGTAPLLLALLGFLLRLNDGMQHQESKINTQIFRVLQLVSLVGLILAIIGGTDQGSSNANTANTGRDLREAGSVLFAVLFLALMGITILFLTRRSAVLSTERKLLYAGLLALPFLCVRIIYTLIVAFSSKDPGSLFYYLDVNVYVEALMQFAMEAIVVTLFIIAGLLTPKRDVQLPPSRKEARQMEAGNAHMPPQEYGRAPLQENTKFSAQQPRYQQPQRNLGDYRPSRMIRSYFDGRS